jgi:histidine triad (HIT) family protein
MNQVGAQAALFGHGDAEVITRPGSITETECAFCAIIRGDKKATRVFEDEYLIAFLDHRPLFHGHTLLVPKLHVQLMSDLPSDRVEKFFLTAQRLEQAIETGLEADGSMILVNNVVSQSVPHLHLHVIPRRRKDGLRFWLGPRRPYDADHPEELYADKIRKSLAAVTSAQTTFPDQSDTRSHPHP